MNDLRTAYRTTVIIGLAMMAGLLVYLVLVGLSEQGTLRLSSPPLPGSVLQAVRFAMLGATAVIYVLVRTAGRRILVPGGGPSRRTSSGAAPAGPLVTSAVIVFALCELPAVLGLVLYFLGRSTADFHFFLFLSLLFFMIHFPRFRHWEEWHRRQGGGAQRP